MEPPAFGMSEVPGSFQEKEAGVIEISALGLRELGDFLPADLIERVMVEAFADFPLLETNRPNPEPRAREEPIE